MFPAAWFFLGELYGIALMVFLIKKYYTPK